MMDNRNEEIEIDLVMMAKYLISKWKIVLVLGIIFAALGFTYKFLNYQLSSVPLAEVDKLFKIENSINILKKGIFKAVDIVVINNIYILIEYSICFCIGGFIILYSSFS